MSFCKKGERSFGESPFIIWKESLHLDMLDVYKRQRWDSPIVLTTMVQFLNTLFLGKNNSVRRFHSLAQSVIILDEVQSIPSKFVSLFNCALNYLSAICGCAVILCTATQPALEQVPHPVYLGTPSEMVPVSYTHLDVYKRQR